MKYILLFFSITLFISNAEAQPTYFKRLSFNKYSSSFYPNPEDSVLHLRNFSRCKDSTSIIEVDKSRSQARIYKIDLNGNIIWETYGSYHGGNNRYTNIALQSTPDGGCVYLENHYSSSSGSDYKSSIYKLGPLGNIEWISSIPYRTIVGFYYQVSYDLAILPNGYACLASDSIYLFDLSGAKKGNINFPNGISNFNGPGQIHSFADASLFLDMNGLKLKIDTFGNVLHTFNNPIMYYDTTFYEITGDSIHKIDPSNGSYLSTSYFPINIGNKILMLSEGGWLRYNSNQIFRYDDQGNLKWTENFSLPHFGFYTIGEQVDGSLITGGTYLSADFYTNHAIDYSSFICTIDSSGNSIIDSTSQVWPGDANDDSLHEFADVIYVALAQGSSGPQRYDTLIANNFTFNGGDIATNFPGVFAMGINHKQCDVYSDGIIDTLDIYYTALGGLYNCWQYPPNTCGLNTLWRLSHPSSGINDSTSVLPYFSCLPDRDSAQTGDTVRFYFILGDNGIIIDSIFGLAFFIGFDQFQSRDIGRVVNKEIISSDLGNLPDQLVFKMANYPFDFALMTGRKDLQNAYLVQDTIGFVDIEILDSTSGNIDLNMSLLSFKAITAGGFPIDFQFNTKPVHLRTLINEVPELNEEKIKLYPNPAINKVKLEGLPSTDLSIQIYNFEGKHCAEFASSGKTELNINLQNYSAGIYLIRLSNGRDISFSMKFLKE